MPPWTRYVQHTAQKTYIEKYNIKYRYKHTTTAPSSVTEGVQWSTTIVK